MVWSGDIVVVVVVVVVPNECYQLLLKTSFQGNEPGLRGRKEVECMHKHNYTDLGNNLVL